MAARRAALWRPDHRRGTAQPHQRIPEYLNKIAELYATQPGSWLWHWSPGKLLALVSAEPPLFPPGTRWAYSNTDCILLGMIIQRVTGHSPAQEIQQRILRPLRLDGTSFPADSVTLAAPAAHGYLPGTGVLVDATAWNPSAGGGAGYGLGVIELRTPCGPAIGHNGAVFGYITDVFTTADGDRQVVLTATLDSPAALQEQESLITRLLCR